MSTWKGAVRGVGALLVVTAVAAVAGCDSTTVPEFCIDRAEPALSVTTLEADTDDPVDDALVVARDGSYADSARTRVSIEGEPLPVGLGSERPGTYDVTAEKEGFSTWSRSGVVVEQGLCGPETVDLTARLTPTG